MNYVRIFLFVFLSATTIFGLQAATITSNAAGGNWNSANTWRSGTVPTSADDVVIAGPVTLNVNATCKTIKINSGSSFSFQTGGFSLTLNGTWTTVLSNSGTFNAGDGKVVFSTTSAGQTVSGTVVFNNVDVTGVSQMTFSSGSTINGTIRMLNSARMTPSAHPNYGVNSTMEISGTYSISTNYYLWGNTAAKTPANIIVVSGSVTAQQAVNIVKTLTINTGAILNLATSCITLKATTFQNITNNGTMTLGGVWVESGVTWNIGANTTLSNLTIQNSAVVNAGNQLINFVYNTTGDCGSSGRIIKLVGTGVFNPGTSTILVNTSANGNASFEGNVTLNNLVLSAGTITTNNTNGSVTINGNLTVNSGANFQYGNTINSGTLTFGSTSTITNNGGTTTNITTSVTTAPKVTTVDNTLSPLSTTTSGGGTFSSGLTLTAPNNYALSSNLTITGTRKVLIIYSPAEFSTNGNSITADSVYVFGKLVVSNSNGIDGFLGTTKIYIDSNAVVEYSSSTPQTIKATAYGQLSLKGAGVKTFGGGTVTIARDFSVTEGNVDLSANPTFVFNGSKNQSIAGLPYRNVTFGGSGNKTLADTSKITGRVMISGTAQLVSNGLLTLVSTSSGTASIGTINTGAGIVGNVNYERYIPAGRMWRFIGWPINGSTVANSWQKTIFVTGPGTGGGALGTQNSNGFDWTASNEQGVYTYNETMNAALNSKWQGIANTSTTINSTLGYRLFIRGDRSQGTSTINGTNYTPLPVTLKGSGTINTGNITVNLTSSNGGGTNNGWQLLSNPYPSAIDWNNSTWMGERNAAIQSTIYVYNPSQNRYGAWNPIGGSVNGGSSHIASGQAFFIKVTANTSLTFREAFKVDNATAGLFGKTSTTSFTNNLKISIGEASKKYDETVVFLYPSATNGVDADLDAAKPDVSNASISTYTIQDSSKLVFNAIPELSANEADTLTLHTPLANYTYNYQLGFTGLATFDTLVYNIFLYDSYLQQTFSITQDRVYPFATTANTPASYNASRFKLIIANNNQPLPVTLLGFAAKRQKEQVVLTWKTGNERNNKHFVIERSNDGLTFTQIGVVKGHGNSNTVISYSFVDESALPTLSYYRLVQVDLNGTESVSTLAWVNGNQHAHAQDENKSSITAFPIPAKEVLHLSVPEAELGSTISVSIVDEFGRTLSKENVYIEEIDYLHTLNTTILKPGMYALVVVLENGEQKSLKFMKE